MTNWELLKIEGVEEACQRIAKVVTNRFEHVVEYGDMLQEAYIAVATHPRQFMAYIEDDNWGLFKHALWCDVTDAAKREARYHNAVVPIDTIERLD